MIINSKEYLLVTHKDFLKEDYMNPIFKSKNFDYIKEVNKIIKNTLIIEETTTINYKAIGNA